MNARLKLRGTELRYVLTQILTLRDQCSITELDEAMAEWGFTVAAGRSSKVISDTLRWEVQRGRVVALGRGLHGAGYVPRSTQWRIERRVEKLRREAIELGVGRPPAPPLWWRD